MQYNLDNGFMDEAQIHQRKPGMRTATIVDVLYADDCVLFTNTVRAMQSMMRVFDEVSTMFGMELALKKTKVVCNQYSKALESTERELEGQDLAQVPAAAQHDTRGSRALATMQVNDTQLHVPVILIRGERIEVVPQFRYLGLMDTEVRCGDPSKNLPDE